MKRIFIALTICILGLTLCISPAEAKKKKGGSTCTSSAKFGNLANNPPHYSFKSGVDRRVNPNFYGALTTASKKLKTNFAISSGFRDCTRNKNARGASNSAHLSGNAVDISSKSPQSLSDSIYATGVANQVLWNTCTPHVHMALDRKGHFSECGKGTSKGKYKRKSSKKSSKKATKSSKKSKKSTKKKRK